MLRQTKKICHGKTAIRGPIDPSSIMSFGTPELVEDKCREAIEILGPEGFILSPGCDIMKETPVKNMEILVKVAKKYGVYNLKKA